MGIFRYFPAKPSISWICGEFTFYVYTEVLLSRRFCLGHKGVPTTTAEEVKLNQGDEYIMRSTTWEVEITTGWWLEKSSQEQILR